MAASAVLVLRCRTECKIGADPHAQAVRALINLERCDIADSTCLVAVNSGTALVMGMA